MIGIGIDFGTSNSTAASFDGDVIAFVELEDLSEVMPTALHLNQALITKTGLAAVSQYIDENQDRIVEFTPEIIAKSGLLTEEQNLNDPSSKAEVKTENVYGAALVDRGLPGRLFRGVKRLLGNADIKRLMVFEHPFRLVALITPIFLHIREKIKDGALRDGQKVVVGRPVVFEGSPGGNQLAVSRLAEAAEYAGLGKVNFYPEPLAATVSYLSADQGLKHTGEAVRSRSDSKGLALTFDFGGGTLDMSIVQYRGRHFDVLATAGMALGGDHIDQLIFKELLFPILGKGEIWSRRVDGSLIETEFPFEEFEGPLLNWAVTYTLNQNHFRAKINDCIEKGGPAREKFIRLDELITHNYSYIVFQAIKQAKAALSDSEQTMLDIAELDVSLPFSRKRFVSLLAPVLASIEQLVSDIMEKADLEASDIDVVIRTGGSSQIASVKRLLERRFPGRVVEHDPFRSVAAGLAVASYYGYGYAGDSSVD
ncbi:MAG TPA: hypothetical protein EYQ22_12740 [Gammaproteobacteria bacterium]|nr:hypothetical protein [Gammaproteobacteria bacterium]HIK68609.1 hypothetical protein [Pseudomonadales bacterium]